MTDFLVKMFVKDWENTQDIQVRTQYGILSSVVGIICNILLFAGKFLIGLLMNSIAIMADAFNNMSDAASSVISFIGVKMASKPADKEHPFGHGRIEYVAALIVSFLVIEVGFTFLKSAIDKLKNPEEIVFQWVPFLILLVSVLVKLWMSVFNRKLGKRIDSKVMIATSADSMGDVITTSATLVSILICHFTDINIDAVAGIIVSFIIMWAGVNIAKDTLEPLIGQAMDPELYSKITEMVESYDGIMGTHDLIIHNYGPNRSMASIHAEVPSNVSIEVSHEIIDRVEREVARKLDIFLVIHMDPVEMNDQKTLEMRKKLERVLTALDEQLTFHDFRMVNGEQQINLIFDIVVPAGYSEEKSNNLKRQISLLMKEIDRRCECVITVDHSFMSGCSETS